MAKKSAWVWVGIIGGIAFLLFGLCVCSIVGVAYFAGQKDANAKKLASRAMPLIQEADATLSELDVMNSILPSERSKANAALKTAADLPRTKEKLSDAKGYLAEASDAGATGQVGTYVDAKLASTTDKLDVVDLRTRQSSELLVASKAAAMADDAKRLMDSGFSAINNSTDFRNKNNYSKAAKYLQSGSGRVTKALRLYVGARRLYSKASFAQCVSALTKAKVAARYKAELDRLGLAGNLARYNKVRNNSNTSWHQAFAIWKTTANKDNSLVVDRAYVASVKDLVSRVIEKTASARRKDSEAGSLESGLTPQSDVAKAA